MGTERVDHHHHPTPDPCAFTWVFSPGVAPRTALCMMKTNGRSSVPLFGARPGREYMDVLQRDAKDVRGLAPASYRACASFPAASSVSLVCQLPMPINAINAMHAMPCQLLLYILDSTVLTQGPRQYGVISLVQLNFPPVRSPDFSPQNVKATISWPCGSFFPRAVLSRRRSKLYDFTIYPDHAHNFDCRRPLMIGRRTPSEPSSLCSRRHLQGEGWWAGR